MIKRVVASAKVIIASFIQLQVFKIREAKKVRKLTKKRKMSFLLNKCLNL